MKLDLHVHTKYSGDSFSTPKSLVRAAKKKGLDGFALTDHDTTKAWKQTKFWAKIFNINLVLGEEVKVYLGNEKIGEIFPRIVEIVEEKIVT